ncbi:MAG: G5 domain-containing protein [Candidatus Avispirillum sp.]
MKKQNKARQAMSELLSKRDTGSADIRRSPRSISPSAGGADVRRGAPQNTRGGDAAVLRTARTPMTAQRAPAQAAKSAASAKAGAAPGRADSTRNAARTAANVQRAGASTAAGVRRSGTNAVPAARRQNAAVSAAGKVPANGRAIKRASPATGKAGRLPQRASQSFAVSFARFITATANRVRRAVKAHAKTVISVAAVAALAVCLCVGITAAVKLSNRKKAEPVRADIVFGAVALSDGGNGGQNEDGTGAEDNAVSAVSVKADGTENSSDEFAAAKRYTVKFSFYEKPQVICTTESRTVGELVGLLGIELDESEQMRVDTSKLIETDTDIAVDTVTHGTASAEVSIDYETKYVDTDTVPRGSTRVQQQGVEGVRTVTYDVTYVNGVETERVETGEYISRQPTDQIVARGVGGTVTLGGTVYSYSYCLVCDSTVYTGGGITASGLPATEQVIAVDPRVIPLGTKVYIEGIGYRIAADTGGLIKGNFIDIYYEESNPNFAGYGRRDVKVYILD